MNAIKRKLDIYMEKKVKCTIKTPDYAANATGSGRPRINQATELPEHPARPSVLAKI